MTAEMLINAAALVALLVACRVTYRDAKRREELDRADAARVASMDAAMTDDAGRCWQCLDAVRVLELVDRGFRYELLCPACATVTKAMTASRQEAA